MKKHIFIFAIFLFFTSGFGFSESIKFSSSDLDGNEVTEKIFSSVDVTVVNVWGTFCGPCIREMPELSEWASKMPKNVQLIGIVSDVNSKTNSRAINSAKGICSRAGVNFKNIIANETLYPLLSGMQFVPTTFLVDRNGNIIGSMIVGANVPKYKKAVEDYLASK